MSDLWKFNGTWAWIFGYTNLFVSSSYGTKGIPDPSNNPGSRYGGGGTFDSKDNFWIFGGAMHIGAAHSGNNLVG